MSLPKVSFVLATSGIGQAAQGNDFISGIPFVGTAPGSFATTPIQAVFSLSDAEARGITLDYSDETQAKAIYTVSGTVTLGDTFAMSVTVPVPVTSANPLGTMVVSLGTATVATAATATGAGTDISAKINAGTYLHGYTASPAAGVITITAAIGTGISLNTGTPLAVVVTGTSTGVITQQFGTGIGGATAGVYSKKAIWHYEVSEFFRANATGKLWIAFNASINFSTDLINLQNAANGEIKQFGVFDPAVTSAATFTSNGTLLQAQMVTMFGQYNPAIVTYTANLKAISDLSTLENQQTKSNYYVSHVITQDGDAVGAGLYITSGISIGNLGCVLGTISKAQVNQCIGEVGAFNITDDTEMAIPAFVNGNLVSALSVNLLTQLDSYRYLFTTRLANITGTYFVEDWTAVTQTSPYYRISRNRVMNKAIRLIYAAVVPLLKSQISLNLDGTIDSVTIAKFSGVVTPVGSQMKSANEISNLKVTINPAQNVISAGKIVLGVAIQPTITADFIEVDMSFVAQIS